MPSVNEESLAPYKVLSCFSNAFPRVESDYGDPASLGLNVIEKYRQTLEDYPALKSQFPDLPDVPTPLREIDAIWRDAVHMQVWLDRATDQCFSAIVNRLPRLNIVFSDAVSTKQRHDTLYRLASLLGYRAETIEEPDYTGPESLESVSGLDLADAGGDGDA